MGEEKRAEEKGRTDEKSFFLPQLAETFGIIVRVNEKGEIVKLGESSGLVQTKKIHTAAANGLLVTREQMVTYVDEGVRERGGVSRKRALEGVDLGTFNTSKEGQRERVRTLSEVFELDENNKPASWNDKNDGFWVQAAWAAAETLRSGKKIKDLEGKHADAWKCLSWDQQESIIVYQELMRFYGIDPNSMFGEDGVLKTVGSENLSVLIKDLNDRQQPPALYQPRQQRFEQWVEYQKQLTRESGAKKVDLSVEGWQQERYEIYKIGKESTEEKAIPFKDWQELDNLKQAHEEDVLKTTETMGVEGGVNLAEVMKYIESERMGEVVHSYLSTEMEGFLDRAYGGKSQLPVSYAIASESGREGIIFTNFFGNRIHDEMVTALRASGDFYFWESVGRLERMIRFTQTGFGENRLSKEAWQTLEGVSPPVVQFILLSNRRFGRGFGQALMLPEIIGVKDWRTGRPGMYNKFNAHGVAVAPRGDEEMGELKPSSKSRESARRKMEDAGYPRWLTDLAMAHSWISGEGVDQARCLDKVRRGEELIFGIVGALVEPFYEYDDKKLNNLTDSQGAKGWGKEYAAKILRWLTPGVAPFVTLTQDAWKLMSMSPWAADTWFSSFYLRMPAYEWTSQADKERLKKTMEALEFSGPYKNIWERYLGEIEHREQKRWGTYFHILVGDQLMSLNGNEGRVWRFPFDFNNKEHITTLAKLLQSGGMADKIREKLESLGVSRRTIDAWGAGDWEGLINRINTSGVREGANAIQKQWFEAQEVEIDDRKLRQAGNYQPRYDQWQNLLEPEDRRAWVDVAQVQASNTQNTLALKLELALRDKDTWKLKADTTNPNILAKLADLGERMAGSLARYFFTTAFGYDDYSGWDRFGEAFPDISMPLDLDKVEELSHRLFNSYPTRTGGLPHIKQFLETLMFRVWFFKKISDINFEKLPGVGPGFPRGGAPKNWMYDRDLRKQLADILEQT